MAPQKKYHEITLEEVQKLTNIAEIEKLLKETQQQEEELEFQMEESIKNDKKILETKLELLEILPTKLKPVYLQIHTLSTKIEETCDLADNVSKKVRLLDNTKHRLQQTQQRLEDIIHVRDCIEGIDGAMKNEEWERACEYIKTYLSIVTQEQSENNDQSSDRNDSQNNIIDDNIVKKKGKVLEESSENLLQQKLIDLRSIIQEKADKADNEEDVKRFCKLFSPLGIPQVGLQRYISYIRNSLKQDAEKIHTLLRKSIERRNITEDEYITCIDAITKLYETVAEYAEAKGDIVKESFDQQSVILLLRNLQQECDVHSTRILLRFQEHFRIPSMVTEVINYSKRAPKFGGGEIQKKDPSEFGELLDAIALVSQRTELFDRFLRKKAKSYEQHDSHHSGNASSQPHPGLLHVSETNRKIQEILDQYIILEQYFMVENVHKAIRLDQENNINATKGKYQSQLVDYVSFILQKSLFRSLSSYNQQSICAIVNFVNQCYSQHLKEELVNLMQSIPGVSGVPRNLDSTLNYMTALNLLYQSSENMLKMKIETENEVNHIFALYPSSKQLINACTSEFQETSKEYKAILKQNLELLLNSVQPKLKAAIDLFRSTNFELNESQFAENEINDPFAYRFIEEVQAILQSFSSMLIQENFESLVQICLHSITIQLEKTLLQKKFTQLGGIQFDKDLRLLVNYFSNNTQRAVRGEFARLMQMASLLNLEKVSEVLDYWGENSGQMTWRLTPSEVRRTLSRRIDFSGEDIANLKL